MKLLKTIRNVVITTIILILLIGVIGVLYALFFNRAGPQLSVNSLTGAKQATPFTPTTPADNAREGVAIEALTPSARPGSTMSVVAITNATSRCTIVVDPSVTPKTDPALAPQSTDAYGTVSWSWTVKSMAPVGNKSLTISCTFHGKTGVVAGTFKVEQ